MAVIKEKTIVRMELDAACPTHARTNVRTAAHEVVIDEPAERGGSDRGPTPTQMLIASLLGCTNVILNKIAAAHRIEVKALSLHAEASFDRRGVTLQEEVTVPFPEIRLAIDITTPATDAQIKILRSELGRFCPVSKVIRQSGTRLEEVWTVTHD